jgi:hypothetical protein
MFVVRPDVPPEHERLIEKGVTVLEVEPTPVKLFADALPTLTGIFDGLVTVQVGVVGVKIMLDDSCMDAY